MSRWEATIEISERDDYHELLAWVKASQRRVDIILTLVESPSNSTEFATEWEVTTEAVKYHLKLLRDGGPDGTYPALVQIVTPQRERYQLWGLTKHGEDLAKHLE